jgi:hypothetical protein
MSQAPTVVVNPQPPQAAAAPPASPSAVAIAGGALQATVTDARGRSLTIQRLSPLQRTRLYRLMGPDDARNMPLLGTYQMAVSVTAINGAPQPFPQKAIHIDMLLEQLGDDGLEAVGKGYKAQGWVETDEGDPAAIKN